MVNLKKDDPASYSFFTSHIENGYLTTCAIRYLNEYAYHMLVEECIQVYATIEILLSVVLSTSRLYMKAFFWVKTDFVLIIVPYKMPVCKTAHQKIYLDPSQS